MRIRVYSDLHLEFMANRGGFVDSLDNDCDVLVLAGDIDNLGEIRRSLTRFGARYRHVVFVCGNHEYYGKSPESVENVRKFANLPTNIHWLENSSVTIEGVRFVGATLWFPKPKDDSCRGFMNDFYVIRDFEPWVYEQNARSQEYLHETVRRGDVVVTHHLPSQWAVSPKYAGHPLNRYFVCEMDSLIEQAQPAVWAHGHSHESFDRAIDDTRVIRNPMGYFGVEINQFFDPKFTVVL